MFNQIWARPPAAMVAETVSIVVGDGQWHTDKLITPSRLKLLLGVSFNGP